MTTGASQDIKQATALARAMVTKYGFSDKVGLVNYGSDEDEVFIGRDLAHTRSYGENVATVIDEEVKGIMSAMPRPERLSMTTGMSLMPVRNFFLIKKKLQEKSLKLFLISRRY